MEGITVIIALALVVFAVAYFSRWWKMADDIRAIREALSPRLASGNFPRLLLLGRKEQAKEAAVKDLLSRLLFFQLGKSQNKEAQMKAQIDSCRQLLNRYGMELPPELATLESFQELMRQSHRPAK